MIWDILLSATIETGLGLLAEAGLGDSVREVRNKWLKTDEKKRRAALDKAFAAAISACADPEIEPLLNHRPFQEEVVRALLDPLQGFNVQSVQDYWGEKFPEHALALRRFFNTLQNTLLTDPLWGPVLERYQNLRFQQDVRQALEDHQLPASDVVLVRAISQTLEPYRAVLSGDGAIAQGPGAKAVGAGAVLVEGSLHQIVNITLNKFIAQGESGTSSADGERKYLELTASQANLLPWTKVTTDYADPSRGESLNLADVYIDLDTTEMRHMEREEELRQYLMKQREAERISAQEMVNRKSKLLMMGDPGSGKSTFVKHLTYLMAEAMLAEDPSAWLERLSHWEHGVLLPVRIELRQLAALAKGTKTGDAKLILNYLHSEMNDWGLDTYWASLSAAIQDKKGGLLFLLDGLDEVPTVQRQLIVDSVNELCALYPSHHYVVTCRPYAYVGQPWRLSGFHEVTLAPFSEEQIERFIENWYERLTERGRIERTLAIEKARRLKDAVRRRDLLGLAERPLLLTVMAQLHAYAGQLPEDRTQLYSDAVQLLLQRWESRLSEERGILEYLAIPQLKMSDLESGLNEVAYRAHQAGDAREGTADISEGQLREWLCRYLNNDWNKAGQFVDYIRERAGLLIRHKTDAYTFPHRSFQEFLSACYWLSMEDYPSESVQLVRKDWDRWREVFVLAAGYAARTNRLGQAIASVNTLLPRDFSASRDPVSGEFRAALLAGQALVEIGLVGVRRESVGQVVLERTQGWLLQAIQAETLEPVRRAEAGRVLAKLGDPRLEVLTYEHLNFHHVPAGEFIFGEDKEKRKLKLGEFWVSRYPITNAQYAQFVEAEGYRSKAYWEEAIQKGYWSKEGFKGDWDNTPRLGPEDYGEPFNLPNHPVVGVSWYEALAYCQWLDEKLKAISSQKITRSKGEAEQALWKGLAQGKLQVTLPTEAEWEKAARGTDGREYPWPGQFDPDKANINITGIGTTSAVGCFPAGASPYGALEMSGNVWEWVRGDKNLRGGSWLDDQVFARCAYRSWNYPDYWDFSGVGFRVVVSPVLPSS